MPTIARRSSLPLLLVLLCGILGATSAHATHPAAGNCTHEHGPVSDPRRCDLTGPEGGLCDVDGEPGICVQEGKYCRCDSYGNLQRQNLDLMANNMRILILLLGRGVIRGIGQPGVCAQFGVLAFEFEEALAAVLALGTLQFYEPRLLGELDIMLLNWKKIARFADRRCGIALVVTPRIQNLLLLKQQMVAFFLLLFPALPPVPTPTPAATPAPTPTCSTGDYATVDGQAFSATVNDCGIASFVIRSLAFCPMLVESFGSNGNVTFALRQSTSDTADASGLEILGNPDHECALTLTPGPTIDLICDDGQTGTCMASYATSP